MAWAFIPQAAHDFLWAQPLVNFILGMNKSGLAISWACKWPSLEALRIVALKALATPFFPPSLSPVMCGELTPQVGTVLKNKQTKPNPIHQHPLYP